MKHLPWFILLVPVFVVSSLAESPTKRSPLVSLVETERDFSKASVSKGMKEAFLNYLDEEAILFRPGPVPGREWMEDHPAPTGILSWAPVFAMVAKSGDLGYTTGPWEFRKQSFEEQPSAFGHYITIWKKERFGTWKVVLDTGIRHPTPGSRQLPPEWPANESSGGKTLRSLDTQQEEEALLRVDQALSKQITSKGLYRSYSEKLGEEPRFYRMELLPIIGRQEVDNYLKLENKTWEFSPEKSTVSGACDLGYTYGSYVLQKPESGKGYYLRIWQKDTKGRWKIVVEVLNPEPPKPAASP